MSNIVSWTGEVTHAYISFLVVSAITAFVLFLRERIEWKRGQFSSRINISLNLVVDGVFCIRTVHEGAVDHVIHSSFARKLLKASAKKTTLEDPFLHFANDRDAWMVYTSILNAISSMYGAHLLAAAARGTVKEDPFLIAATWERDADIRIQKLRVLMVQESTLEDLVARRDSLTLEEPYHKARIETLLKMHDQFKSGAWPQYQIVSLPRI